MILVTACMIARDEAGHLGACLDSLSRFVDEIVVVDTGSVDATRDIAKSFGARVIDEPWRDDFAFHRNTSLAAANGRWSLVIDADERVVDTDVSQTRAKLEADGLPNLLLVTERLEYPGGHLTTILAPRLLRTAANIRYIHNIHEQLAVEDENALVSNVVLHHDGYRAHDAILRKEERNLRIAESMPASSHSLHSVARAAHSLGYWARVIRAATELLARPEAPVTLRREVAVLAALAAVALRDTNALGTFIHAASLAERNHPDSVALALLDAAGRYMASVNRFFDHPAAAARPPILMHDTEPAERLLQTLLRRASPGPRLANESTIESPLPTPVGGAQPEG